MKNIKNYLFEGITIFIVAMFVFGITYVNKNNVSIDTSAGQGDFASLSNSKIE